MSRHPMFYTLGACALAGVVLAVTIMLSPKVGAPEKPPEIKPDPEGRFGPPDLNNPGKLGGPIKPGGVIEKYYVRRVNREKNQLTIMTGDRFVPRPNGVGDIENPTAYIHLVAGRRVLKIAAKEGTLIAPDNNPQAGDLRGGTVLTLYESEGEETVDLKEDSRDVRLRIYLDQEVHFDLELGLVESKGPVQLTSPRTDFKGTGLTLIYNEKRNRINRLEIAKGQLLRYNATPLEAEVQPQPPQPAPPATTTSTKPPAASTPADTKVNGQSDAPTKEPDSGEQTEPSPAPKPREPDYYVAVFEDQVAVRTADAALDADRMDLIFAMQNGGGDKSQIEQLSAADNHIPPAATTTTTAAATLAPAAAPPSAARRPSPILSPPIGRSMMPTRADDINITWNGRLVVQPIEELPAGFAGKDDSHATLIGNVRIRSIRKETVNAERVEYLASTGHVKIWGTPQKPFVVDSAAMGRIIGQFVDLDQATGVGRIEGPGSIVSFESSALIANAAPARAEPEKEGQKKRMTITWSQAVDLTFAVKEAQQSNTPATRPPSEEGRVMNPSTRLEELKSATFFGDVDVDHPQLALEGDRLALKLVNTEKHRQQPEHVKITSRVRAKSRDTKPKDALAIEAEDLEIFFKPDKDGRMQPSRMVATDKVKAAQPDRQITAGLLDVGLAQVERKPETVAPKAGNTEPVAQSQLSVTTVHAMHDVKVRMENPRTLVDGHQLDADAQTGLLQVFGPADKPAKVQREENSIVGRQIIMNDKDQKVKVVGPGEADFVTTGRSTLIAAADSTPAKEATKKPQQPEKVEPHHMHITWLNGMDFDNFTGVGHFRGGVVATSDRGVDLSRLQADDIVVEFDPLEKKKDAETGAGAAASAASAPDVKDSPNDKPAPKPRTVRKLVAKEQVVFESEKWADRIGGKLATRLRLTGPLLNFDNVSEQIIITGAGSMQIEDYRDRKKDADADGAKKTDPKPADASSPVAFVGKGVTLFIWQKQLTLDAKRNDVRMDEDVRMIQQQENTDKEVFMDCSQLVADFASTGGLDSWLNGKAGTPELDNLTATGPIKVKRTDFTITGDQLYYTSNKSLVLISSEGTRQCELIEGESVLPAKRFKWYLDSDKRVAEEPGAIRQRASDTNR